MKIEVTKGSGPDYAVTVHRPDGVILDLKPVGASSELPHDLVHFIVESELGLVHGLWGMVAAGGMFPGLTVVHGRRKPHARERSKAALKGAGQRATQAENLTGIFLRLALEHVDERAPARAAAAVNKAWRPAGEPPTNYDHATVSRVCRGIRSRRDSWQRLPIGETISFDWPHEVPDEMKCTQGGPLEVERYPTA